jgi:hypothetical protein
MAANNIRRVFNEPIPKSIFASKTFWFNALVFVSAVLVAVTGNSDFAAKYPQFTEVSFIVLSAVNVALRFVTSEPVKLK